MTGASGPRRARPWVVGAFIAGILVGVLAERALTPLPTRTVTRLSVSVPPSVPVNLGIPNRSSIAISPDGTRVVYRGGEDNAGVYVRALDEIEAVPLRGAEGGNSPFVSPDGTWVGFVAGSAGRILQKVSILGGPRITICQLPAHLNGASWSEDGTIVFGVASSEGLMRVSDAGGDPEAITTTNGATRHAWPHILPEGKGVLFTLDLGPGPWNEDIALLNLDTGEHRVIIPDGTHPRYSPTGHIVYGAGGTLHAIGFNLDTLDVTAGSVPVVEGVLTTSPGAAMFDLSEAGSLVYVHSPPGAEVRTLVWVDREGNEDALPLPPRFYLTPRVSPDGGRVAVGVTDLEGTSLWVYDVMSAAGLRLTHDSDANLPLWMPHGERLVFGLTRDGLTRDLYWIPADGSAAPERLTTSDTPLSPTSTTPDGSSVVYMKIFAGGRRREIWRVPVDGERAPVPIVQGEFALGNAEVSPDGRWLAYRSDQSGQPEVYLQPYPGPGPTIPVSISGGNHLTWSTDGSELFYRQGTRMMAVAVHADGTVGTRKELFEGNYVMSSANGPQQYHAAPDGRFLMLRAGDASTSKREALPQVILVRNWTEELGRLVETD